MFTRTGLTDQLLDLAGVGINSQINPRQDELTPSKKLTVLKREIGPNEHVITLPKIL